MQGELFLLYVSIAYGVTAEETTHVGDLEILKIKLEGTKDLP